MARSLHYKDAGVDIEAGDAFVEEIRRTNPDIGGFSGLLSIPRGYKAPQLVVSTDGVGTKLLVARELHLFDTIGIDLVAMVVNDLLACGAQPFAFLDYYACDELRLGEASEILRGIHAGCAQAGCALVGGETAELPGVYPDGGFDLAGFGVGVVEKGRAISGDKIRPGDVLIGLPSSGIHSNGLSLARRVLLDGKKKLRGARRRAALENLLIPTAIYVKPVLKLLRKIRVKGIAHITGGGIPGNLKRVLPENSRAVVNPNTWTRPEIFDDIAARGPVEQDEMYTVFNMGIGMILVVAEQDVRETVKILRRSLVHAVEIGAIVKGPRGVDIDGIDLFDVI